MLSITDLARRYVAKMPAAVSGSGGHDQTFAVACALIKGFNLAIDEARPILLEYNGRCEPPWSMPELEHKLASADGRADMQTRGWLRLQDVIDEQAPRVRTERPAPEPKPEFRNDKLTRFASRWRQYVDTAWLADRSVVDPFEFTSRSFLQLLYNSAVEKVVVFTNDKSQGQALWPGETLPVTGKNGVWFLAQPVDGRTYPNPRNLDDKGQPIPSRRSEESVIAWRYLVLESDEARARDWMSALVQLPLSIAAIYTSGSRSVHALVRVDARTKHEWDEIAKAMKPIVVTLGADPRSLSAVRLTRLPGCMREGKKDKAGNYQRFPSPVLQKLLYLNPSPKPDPICSLPRLRDVLGPRLTAAKFILAKGAADVVEAAGAKDLSEVITALEAAADARRDPFLVERVLEWFESAAPARESLLALRSRRVALTFRNPAAAC